MLPLPGKPPFNPDRPAPYWINAAQVYNGLYALSGHNPFAISGLANADMESSFEPYAVGDKGTAYNLWQHHWSPRGERILAATGIDVRTERSIKKVCGALWWELNNVKPYKTAFTLMLAAPTYEAACPLFTKLIEGAGAANAVERRVQDAQFWGVWIGKNAPFIARYPAV